MSSSAMSIGSQTVGLASILKEGLKTYKGVDAVTLRNISAVLELGDLVRTSLGPCGRTKLIPSSTVNRTIVSADCRTMLSEANVFHPAAKMLAEAAQQHGLEHGDGSATLVVLCCALLARAGELVQQGVRPPHIVRGFELALAQALQLLDGLVIERLQINWTRATVAELEAQLRPAMLTATGSKHGDDPIVADTLARLASEAMAIAVPYDRPQRFDLDNVRVVKVLGGGLGDSRVLRGIVLNRLPETRLKSLSPSEAPWKVAVFSCELDLAKTETKGTVLMTKAEQMKSLGGDEEAELVRVFQGITEAGAKLLVTQDRIGELALHVLDRLGLVALRVPSKFDVRRTCRATGAQCLTSLTHDQLADSLGQLSFLKIEQIGGDWVSVLDAPGAISSVVLRGSAQSALDDHERTIVNAVAVARGLLSSNNVSTEMQKEKKDGGVALVCGAGACEAELAKRLREWISSLPQALSAGDLSVMAMRVFPDALLSIPEALSDNAGYSALDALALLEAAHLEGAISAGVLVGVDSDGDKGDGNGISANNPTRDLLTPKREALRMATKIACMLLGVEQILMCKPATGAPSSQRPASSLDAD